MGVNTLAYLEFVHVHIHMYTGYRPILDAMKTFAVENQKGVVDIEVQSYNAL